MNRTAVLVVCAALGASGATRAEGLAIISDHAVAEYVQCAPAFSPDGGYLAWIERDESRGRSYVRVEAGAGIREVRGDWPVTAFCWAPFGHVLAYVQSRRQATLGFTDLDTDESWEVPVDAVEVLHAMWRGGEIQAVVRQRGPERTVTCCLASIIPEVGEIQPMTEPLDFQVSRWERDVAFAWSPEGTAAAVLRRGATPPLYVWRAELRELMPHSFLPGLNVVPSRPLCLAVGPEGNEIFLAAAFADDANSAAIWRYEPGGAAAEPVLQFADGERPLCIGVSPTGDRIAVVSAAGQGDAQRGVAAKLRVADIEQLPACVEQNIELGHGLYLLLAHGGDDRSSRLAWSPDGTWVAYAIGGYVRRARIGTDADLCASHLKQLALASLMFATDWDDALPGAVQVERLKQMGRTSGLVEGPDWWTGLIYPYTRNRSLMQCPLMAEDEGSGYVYPEHLWGKNVGDIENPSKTILLMDSAPRHEGKRVVAFADGHVEVVAEEDVQKLLDQQ